MASLSTTGKTFSLLTLFSVFSLISCSPKNTQETTEVVKTDSVAAPAPITTSMTITKEDFGKAPDGTAVDLYTLKNEKGMTVKITNYGAVVTSIITPDKNGEPGDVVLGFDSVPGYYSKEFLKSAPYFGAIVGRYGNRIAKGRFILDSTEYKLATNNKVNHLHGGLKGFDKVIWQAEEIKNEKGVGVKLTYVSKDGEEGYPGNLTTSVVYSLTDDNELKIEYTAETDKATPLNLTNHSYFNLAAGKAKDALQHELTIASDRFTAVDATLIPTGVLQEVKGTPMDFSTPHTIGERLAKVKGGYDHNYVLTHPEGQFSQIVTVYEPTSGRVMEVYTDQPGVQFYSGNFLDGTITGKNGIKYVKHYGFCLETQHFPDSPNQPTFPSAILKPGEKYHTVTAYKFSVKK
ncbi:MAG: aldose epimerase family protein [Bacteroidota bacterium]